MTTYFTSDIHLTDTKPQLLKLFEYFIRHILQSGDTLYILGDLFEYWIGDDQTSYVVQTTKTLLKHLAKRRVRWYFLAGNRDFLIGKKFLQETHGILLPEKEIITLNHHKILLLHWDTLCTNDYAYQAWRKKVQKKWLQKLFLMLPLWARQRMADRMRAQSLRQGALLTEMMMDVVEHSVAEEFEKYAVDVIIHGHVHRPAVHIYDTDKMRYVLADWDEKGNYLAYDGQFELKYFG
jgi:UDP-2,3-diacylglucosamine hydrolase